MNGNILDTIDMRTVGKELQQARIKRGLTQEEAAKCIGVARTTLTVIEKGERRIKAEELIRLAQVYGRQVSDFVRLRPQIEPFRVQFHHALEQISEDDALLTSSIDTLEE